MATPLEAYAGPLLGSVGTVAAMMLRAWLRKRNGNTSLEQTYLSILEQNRKDWREERASFLARIAYLEEENDRLREHDGAH